MSQTIKIDARAIMMKNDGKYFVTGARPTYVDTNEVKLILSANDMKDAIEGIEDGMFTFRIGNDSVVIDQKNVDKIVKAKNA